MVGYDKSTIPLFEYFRYAFLGTGSVDNLQLLYSTIFMIVVSFGVMLFNKMVIN
jgi:hypothetical protein